MTTHTMTSEIFERILQILAHERMNIKTDCYHRITEAMLKVFYTLQPRDHPHKIKNRRAAV